MLRRDAGKSISICYGFGTRNFFHLGRGFLPLLAVMLLAAPQLAFAQDSLAVTVNPRVLRVTEDQGQPGTPPLNIADGSETETYTVVLDSRPAEDVKVTVVGETASVTVDSVVGTDDSVGGTKNDEGVWELEFSSDESCTSTTPTSSAGTTRGR